MSCPFDYELEEWLLILEVILKREQPLHAAISQMASILLIEFGNTETSKTARLEAFNLCLP